MLPRHECPNCQFTLGANAAKCDYCRMYRLGESSGTARSIPARCAAAVALAMLVVGALGQWPLTSWRSPAPTPSARALLSPGHDSQSVLVRKLAAPSWSPLQATGEPDTLNGGDVHTAWASQETDAGREWLELEYDPPIRADHVRIYESFNPGAVIALILRDANGKAMRSVTVFDTVRQGPSVTEVTLPLDPEPVRFVKVILDTARVPGWNEIDAVELLGPDARGWAVDAKASTYYKFESWSRRTRPDLPVLPPPPSWPSYRDIPSWSPLQATGAPDTLIAGDHGTAWASLETDKGLEWLELGYKPAIRATQVRIRETFNPGAVTGMTLLDEQGVELAQLTVSNTCREAPVFLEVPFPLTKRPVARVKIVLDTAKVPGWNEIDAVELVGPDARGWAVDAKASSSFADRWNVDDRSRAPHGQ